MKGKLANGVGRQYPSYYLATWLIQITNNSTGACTHTSFLPESDPAPVVEFFTRTGITAANGQLILNAAQDVCT